MAEPCAIEECFDMGSDKIVLGFELAEDIAFSVFLCPGHSTTFRELAGDRFTDDLGMGLTVFNARLVD